MVIWTKYDMARDVHGFPDWGVNILNMEAGSQNQIFTRANNHVYRIFIFKFAGQNSMDGHVVHIQQFRQSANARSQIHPPYVPLLNGLPIWSSVSGKCQIKHLGSQQNCIAIGVLGFFQILLPFYQSLKKNALDGTLLLITSFLRQEITI